MTKGWIAIVAGGAPKQVLVQMEGAKEHQYIVPVFSTHGAASAYWFGKSPEKAWGIMEVTIAQSEHANDPNPSQESPQETRTHAEGSGQAPGSIG